MFIIFMLLPAIFFFFIFAVRFSLLPPSLDAVAMYADIIISCLLRIFFACSPLCHTSFIDPAVFFIFRRLSFSSSDAYDMHTRASVMMPRRLPSSACARCFLPDADADICSLFQYFLIADDVFCHRYFR